VRRVAFDSDGPGISHIKRNIKIIRGLPLSEDVKVGRPVLTFEKEERELLQVLKLMD